MIPGETFLSDGAVPINQGRQTVTLRVSNTGDRPIQVGSHTHFFEANSALGFDRALAYGFHLNVPAGTAVRFEPGEEREIDLVAFAGRRYVYGMRGLVMGDLAANHDQALQRQAEEG